MPLPKVLCICVFKKGNSILVAEGYDRVKGETFYRPLGGKLEFGEYGHQAVARELREEIGADVVNLRFIGTIENIFSFEGKPGHEIVLVYDGDFADKSLEDRTLIEGFETSPEDFGHIRATWKPMSFFKEKRAPLYPEGLLDLLVNPNTHHQPTLDSTPSSVGQPET